jgi:hypothetical protein
VGADTAGGSVAADARVELERNRAALAAVVRQVEIAIAGLPPTHSAGWSGPAAWAFHAAVSRLHSEVSEALRSLRAAELLTSAAIREVEHGV